MNSPVSQLIAVLESIKITAQQYQNKFIKSEASTRIALIDPLLRALGWETSNPNMIEFEKVLPPQSRADYALYDSEGNIQVIIEAKALGANLGDKAFIFNIIMYALAAGIKDIFLTDGIKWEHFTDFAPGNVTSNSINIEIDSVSDCAMYLITKLDVAKYWHKESKTPNIEQQLLELRNEILSLKSRINENHPVIPPIVSPNPPAKEWINLRDIKEDLKGSNPPQFLRLPDGSKKEIKRWRDILLECCLFVLKTNKTLPIPFPDSAGKKVMIFDYKPLPEGIAKHETQYNGKVINIYTNYDSNHCIINSIYILNYAGETSQKMEAAVKYENKKGTQEKYE